jgi:hypothetical protein
VTFRCEARVKLDDDVRTTAALIPTPFDSIEWAPETAGPYAFQCKLSEVPHTHHAAFLRTGSSQEPCSDVFLCWHDETGPQWLEDVEVCLKRRHPMATGCTIFRGHPGLCDWEYIDPPMVAAGAQADQLIMEMGLSHTFKRAVSDDSKGGA